MFVANYLATEFSLASVHEGQVMKFLYPPQQDKGYSLFCNFLSVYECESVRPLKVRALRMGYFIYCRLLATFLSQKQ